MSYHYDGETDLRICTIQINVTFEPKFT